MTEINDSAPPSYVVLRLCSTCKVSYTHPLQEGWRAIDGVWRCPLCVKECG